MTPVSEALCAVMLTALVLGGCAASGLNYPSTAGIEKVTRKTLSTSEQKAVIEDLQNGAGTSEPKSVPLITGSTSGSE